MKRRDFLKLSALSSAAIAFTGCDTDPVEKLIPLLNPPEHYIPGKSIYYATTCQECSAYCGIVVRTREGRAVKIEGNPLNPENKGKTCARGQAAIQGLYSPQRMPGPVIRQNGLESSLSWKEAISKLASSLTIKNRDASTKILYIGKPQTGTYKKLVKNWLAMLSGGDYVELDVSPVHSVRLANGIAFGRNEIPQIDFADTKVLLGFSCDFLESWQNPVKSAYQFSSKNRYQAGQKGKFFHISPFLSQTGSNSDDWFNCHPDSEVFIALYLAKGLLEENPDSLNSEDLSKLRSFLKPFTRKVVSNYSGVSTQELKYLLDETKKGPVLAIGGGNCCSGNYSTFMHLALNILNTLSGAINRNIIFGADYKFGGDSLAEVSNVIKKLNDGSYSIVIIDNINPIHILPNELGFKNALGKANLLISFSTEKDESSEIADLHLPTNHYLQSWGDHHFRTGGYSLQQPVMKQIPGFNNMEAGDIIIQSMQLLNPSVHQFKNYQEYLKISWKHIHAKENRTEAFDPFWQTSLQEGGYFKEINPKTVSLNLDALKPMTDISGSNRDSLSLLAFNTSMHTANSKSAGNLWLLEAPDPVSQIPWDSWLYMHPDTASSMSLKTGDLVKVQTKHGQIETVLKTYIGINKQTVAVPAGLGKSVKFPDYASRKGKNRLFPVIENKDSNNLVNLTPGSNVMNLLSARAEQQSGDYSFVIHDVEIKKISSKGDLVLMDGKVDVSRRESAAFYSRKSSIRTIRTSEIKNGSFEPPAARSEYTDKDSDAPAQLKDQIRNLKTTGRKTVATSIDAKWEMAIDLDKCTGCSACVIACYAENNIPVVGKERMKLGREMSWLRIERFYKTDNDPSRVRVHFSPQMCAQCDNAGCEPVCPVYATYQTDDGLNAMIYNRCVGTRYCANNCIFQQRRFNWRTYEFPSPLHYQLNPDVSVREKGVMEKCTFCHHRIRENVEQAKKDRVDISKIEVKTACQQVCPSSAIIFGNVLDKGSEIYKAKYGSKRSYTQLKELNYQPAVTYLAKVIDDPTV